MPPIKHGESETQTEKGSDALDRLFQEYRSFFRSKADKSEYFLLNISAKLEDLLLKGSILQKDGSKNLQQKPSLRLKEFLESDPELSIEERKAIASTIRIKLLDNGKVETKPNVENDLHSTSSHKSKALEENAQKNGLQLIKDLVQAQKNTARKRAETGNQPVSFAKIQNSITIGAIDNRMAKTKISSRPSASLKSILKTAYPLGGGHNNNIQKA